MEASCWAFKQVREQGFLLVRRSSSPILLVEAQGIRLGNRCHTAATAETTGYWLVAHHAANSQPRGRLRSAVSCPAPRRCAPAARFQQCSVQRPSVTILGLATAVRGGHLQLDHGWNSAQSKTYGCNHCVKLAAVRSSPQVQIL